MHPSLALPLAVPLATIAFLLTGSALAIHPFPHPDTEALIAENAHLHAREAYASAYADAYHELAARWAEPEMEFNLDDAYLAARDLDEHYFDERAETDEQRRAREAELARLRAQGGSMVPQFPVPGKVVGVIQAGGKILAGGGSRQYPAIAKPRPDIPQNPAGQEFPLPTEGQRKAPHAGGSHH
ncbi:hypothetical protein MMC34_001327 [Xylographa carneopallida]|nr:hypothetical protein [Xylographa carneopallida]